ncbi:NAD(P)H-dependent oxidoreductase subunit E [Mycoplasmatota bacterium WC44]
MNESQAIEVKKPVSDELPLEKFNELDQFINGLNTTKGALIQVLHKAQNIFGYLPSDLQLYVARKLGLSGAEVSGVVTFYSYFTTKPQGKHVIGCCTGTACFVKGADNLMDSLKGNLNVQANEITDDGMFTLKDVRCIGACGLAPVVVVDEDVHGKLRVDQIEDMLNQYRQEDSDEKSDSKLC